MATEGHLEKWVNLHEDFGGYEVERKDRSNLQPFISEIKCY